MINNFKQEKNKMMEGYNPRIYRRLSWLFGILTILNLVVIVYAFALTGYGLWHAEDALSYIAKINSSFEHINENVLNIVIYEEDKQLVSESIDRIYEYHREIVQDAADFRAIDLSKIDQSVTEDFDVAMTKIENYYSTALPRLDSVKTGYIRAEELQSAEMENLRKEASEAIDTLFAKQDTSTYGFFCRIGQSFLLVPLFLISTMSAGLFAISKSRKRDYQFALNLKSSQQSTDKMRQKAKAIAYTNVLTGLRNRYVFNDRLKECMSSGDVNVALFSFDHFKSINEMLGRELADEFIIAASQKLTEQFGKQAEVFSTESDELCVLFNQDIPKGQAFELSEQILSLLSQNFTIHSMEVRVNVAGCFKSIPADPGNSSSSIVNLFVAMDQCIHRAIAMTLTQNKSQLLQA